MDNTLSDESRNDPFRIIADYKTQFSYVSLCVCHFDSFVRVGLRKFRLFLVRLRHKAGAEQQSN